MSKQEIGLDLTKIKVLKFSEYIFENIQVDREIDKEELKKIGSNIGLDLINDKSGYKIDITKYIFFLIKINN